MNSVIRVGIDLANQLRGLLADFGIIAPKGVSTLKRQWPELRLRHADRVPLLAWEMLDGLFDQMREQNQLILRYERQLTALNRDNAAVQRLQSIQGVGPLTASAIVATVGNAHLFKNGRQFAARGGPYSLANKHVHIVDVSGYDRHGANLVTFKHLTDRLTNEASVCGQSSGPGHRTPANRPYIELPSQPVHQRTEPNRRSVMSP